VSTSHNGEEYFPARKILRVVSNLRRIDGMQTCKYVVSNTFIGDRDTVWGGVRLFFQALRHDVVVMSGGTRRLLIFCLLQLLLPVHRCKTVAVDYILPLPIGLKQDLSARIKGLLLRKVDKFILHFTDTESYQHFYAIPRARCVYVPFKVNHIENIPPPSLLSADGEYVFTAGRSFRDFSTFIGAMGQVDYPGLLLFEDAELMRKGGTEIDLNYLPCNLKVERNACEKSWIDYIARAKVVVVPLLPTSAYAPGLSLYLMAMAMGKCVIITEGPSTRGVLTNEAIIVPPRDPIAMANAIRQVWEDDDLRKRTAEAGRRYAERCGGESRLYSDIVTLCGELVDRG
jgi:glycosyltransferase involved in cell wall biosynthesis